MRWLRGWCHWGLCRVGRRRAAMSHVSCTPSSNRTCGFPASGSPIIFFRRLAPQSFQVAHLSHHLVQPASVMKEVIPPSFLGSPPGALVLSSEPQLQLAPNGPVHLMEGPVAVANPEIGTPPIPRSGSASGSPRRLARSTETTAPPREPADGYCGTPSRVATSTSSAPELSGTQNRGTRSLLPPSRSEER